MKNVHYSDKRIGSWIWIDIPSAEYPQHALFRRDFVLDDIPGYCELQLACNCYFELYVNSHFFTCGPMPNANGNTSVCSYDISHLMEIGENSIAVHVYCDYRPTTSHIPYSPGIWIQLTGDSTPIIWTDSKWQAYPLGCYALTDLAASPAESIVEILDYRQFPNSWLNITQMRFETDGGPMYENTRWGRPQTAWALKDSRFPMAAEARTVSGLEPLEPQEVLSRGSVSLSSDVQWVSFAEPFSQKGQAGLYAAETYVKFDAREQHSLYCFSATPFKLFVNGTLEVKANVPPQQHRYSYPQIQNKELMRLENTQLEATVTLEQGWNKITIVKWCDVPHSGFTMIFGDLPSGTLSPRRLPEDNAAEGWSVTGPIRTPLQLLSRNFTLESLPKYPFANNDDIHRDEAAFSMASEYSTDENAASLCFPIALAANQTAVLDFGRTLYAMPRIRISSGNQDDILDVILGEHLIDGEVIALENGVRRNVSTLILNDCRQPIVWPLTGRRGFRYLMLKARRAKTVITVQSVQAFVPTVDAQILGTFECSDDVLNDVWTAGAKTLDATLQGEFLDSPTKDQTQCLPDSMIQALSAFFTHGAYQQSAEALCVFAHTQLETGELNSLTPSSFFQAIPDFSLMWPIWLQKHLMFTADQQLCQKLLPTLNHLMDYYNSLAVEDCGPLGQLEKILGNHPFLDLGDIDRNGISTGLNAIYCRALFAAAWIAEFAALPELQQLYRHRAAVVARAVRNLTWNENQHLFADGYSNAQQSPFFSWQTNVLAIYGGIARPEQFQTIWNQLFTDKKPFENYAQGDENNPYFKYFILDIAFANGRMQWACDFMRYYWGTMLDAGATTFWELFDPDNESSYTRICSHCQGYAVSPNAFIISNILGVRPSEPGMTTLFFEPDLEDVTWCRATLPTPQGRVSVSWELQDGNVLDTTIQSNYPVSVIPILSPKYASKANFHISDLVTILAADPSAPADAE